MGAPSLLLTSTHTLRLNVSLHPLDLELAMLRLRRRSNAHEAANRDHFQSRKFSSTTPPLPRAPSPSPVSASSTPAARLWQALSRTAVGPEGYTSDGGQERIRFLGLRKKSARKEDAYGGESINGRQLGDTGGRTTARAGARRARDRHWLRIAPSPLTQQVAMEPAEASNGNERTSSTSTSAPAIVVPVPCVPWRTRAPSLLPTEQCHPGPSPNALLFDAPRTYMYLASPLPPPPPPPIPKLEHTNATEMTHGHGHGYAHILRRPSTASGALDGGSVSRFSGEASPALTPTPPVRERVPDEKIPPLALRSTSETACETSLRRYKSRSRRTATPASEHAHEDKLEGNEDANKENKENTPVSVSVSAAGERTGTETPLAGSQQKQKNASALAAQSHFVLKSGKRHHRYSAKEVPFPRNYDRLVLDHEVWDALFYEQLVGGVSYLRFSVPPARVLDLGCGPGAWILNAARVWKNTHFYGLDIVPIQPDLTRVGSSDLAKRVTWVHTNILDGLPFPDNFFDFIFTKRISRAVPENKIDALADECLRTLKPGAAIEVVDEDLYFPGSCKAETENDGKNVSLDGESFRASRSVVNLDPNLNSNVTASPVSTRPAGSSDSPTEPPTDTKARSKRLSEPTEPFRMKGTETLGPELDVLRPSASASDIGYRPAQTGLYASHGAPGTLATARNENDARRMGSPAPLLDVLASPPLPLPMAGPSAWAERTASTRKRSLSTTRTLGGRSSTPTPTPTEMTGASFGTMLLRKRSQNRSASHSVSTSADGVPGGHTSGERADMRMGGSGSSMAPPRSFGGSNFSFSSISGGSSGPPYPSARDTDSNTSLLQSDKSIKSFSTSSRERDGSEHHGSQRTKSMDTYHPSLGQPLNPRDHSLLERIYAEMHADRFINLKPLSLFAMCMEMIFTHVTSHAPISFTFPPRPQRRYDSETCSEEYDPLLPQHTPGEIDHAIVQYARNTVLSSRRTGDSTQGHVDTSTSTTQTRLSLSRADELASQYVIIDNARLPAAPTRMRRPKPRISTKTVSSASGTLGSGSGSGSGETLMSPARSVRSARSEEAGSRSAHPLSESPLMFTDGTDHLATSSSSSVPASASAPMPMPIPTPTPAPTPSPPPQPATPLSPGFPVKLLEIDLKSLHMHLSTRVVETLACAEAMWEWVLAEQEHHAEAKRRVHVQLLAGAGGVGGDEGDDDPQMSAIREMSRADFDSCLSRFEMDMQDKIALDAALEQYLHLKPHRASSRSAERKTFDTACAAWDALNASETGAASAETKYLSRTIRIYNAFKPL